MTDIRVEIRSSATDIAGDWNDLLTRAPANAFLDPAGLSAVFETGYAKAHILLAWERSAAGERLVGVWGLEEKRLTPFGPRYLSTPPHFYALIGSPVVDPARDAETMDAFFAAIAADPRLPKTIRLKYLDGDSPVHAPTMRALGAHAREITEPLVRERPFVTREQGVKRSGSTRKKLRQDWNRLAALGATDYVNDRAPPAVLEGFETFLALEEASWKGENGTALLCDDKDAAFTRRFIAGMAAAGKASVALLRVDGKPIAAQVLLYCGTFAYTWKIAYSADYGKYSPGAVLVDKVTEDLFVNGTEAIESCSPEGGFMVQMWEGRRRTVDLLASVAPGKSLAFRAVLFRDRGVAELKRIRDRLRTLQWRPKKKIAVPAVAKTAS